MAKPRSCNCGECKKCRRLDQAYRSKYNLPPVYEVRRCAAHGCSQPFEATRSDRIYCSRRCGISVAQHRYHASEKGRAYKREWLAQNPGKQTEYQRRWYENGGWQTRAAFKREHREKTRAHTQVGRAIARGDLIRGPCEVCGEAVVDAHHEDYSKPLAVRWLCRRHHAEAHSREVVLSQPKS